MSRRTIRNAPRIPFLLVPFIAAALLLWAIGKMIWMICQGIATLRASKRAKVRSEAPQRPVKARKPAPPMTEQDREDAEAERHWTAQIRAAKRDGRSKPPVVRVGGKRKMGRVVDIEDLPEPPRPPPPAPRFEPWPEWEDAAPPPEMAGATPF